MRDRMREKILVDLIKDKIHKKDNMIDITQMKNNIKLTHKKDMKNNIIQLTHNKDFILLKNNTPKKDSTLKKDNSHKTLMNNNI